MVRIVLTILLMTGWVAHIVDVNGAFLLGEFRENEHIYMKVQRDLNVFTVRMCCCTYIKLYTVLKMRQRHFGDYCLE